MRRGLRFPHKIQKLYQAGERGQISLQLGTSSDPTGLQTDLNMRVNFGGTGNKASWGLGKLLRCFLMLLIQLLLLP